MSAPGGKVGPYVLEARLGRGGMGTVFRARHADLGVVRAVKVLARAGARERFAREAARLAEVRHPGIVGVHEAGVEADGTAWLPVRTLGAAPTTPATRARPAGGPRR